jgi:hypothetical protein
MHPSTDSADLTFSPPTLTETLTPAPRCANRAGRLPFSLTGRNAGARVVHYFGAGAATYHGVGLVERKAHLNYQP